MRHIAAITAPVTPAAPNVCPVHPLVELQGVEGPNTEWTAVSSMLSFALVAVPCR